MGKKDSNYKSSLKLPKWMLGVWFKGFINGRTGTAILNDEQLVQSGYIQMFQKQFEGYTAEQIKRIDKQIHLLSAEAEKLLMELERLNKPFLNYVQVPEGASVIQQRAVERKNAQVTNENQAKSSRKKEVRNRLIDIRTEYSELETVCQEHLFETAAKIEAVLACYCKGVLFRKPLCEKNIPKMNISDAIKQFHESVEWTSRCLKHIDEEVSRSYEKK